MPERERLDIKKTEGATEKLEEARGISELAKEILKESRHISIDEIKASNEEISATDTNFLERSIKSLKYRMTEQEFEQFNDSLKKYPLVDLACGLPSRDSRLLDILFEARRRTRFSHGNEHYMNEVDIGVVEPKSYVGIDKFREDRPPKEVADKVNFVKMDMIEYLRTLPDNAVNISIGGFDMDISRPKDSGENGEDMYRAIMMAEIARVLAKNGYLIAAESPMYGKWRGQGVTLEKLGLKDIQLQGRENPFCRLKVAKKELVDEVDGSLP